MAQLLAAKLFSTEKEVIELTKEIQSTQLWKAGDKDLREKMDQPVSKLQLWVFRSFACDGQASVEVKRFYASVVKPACSIAVDSLPDELATTLGRYLAILGGTEAEESDAHNIKIACSALKGDLEHHPLIQGRAASSS